MSVWRRIAEAPEVTIRVDGQPLRAREGDSVATALLAAGQMALSRNARTGAPQGGWCMIGVCFGCLCEIDGRPGEQACLTPVQPGMAVRTDFAPKPEGSS